MFYQMLMLLKFLTISYVLLDDKIAYVETDAIGYILSEHAIWFKLFSYKNQVYLWNKRQQWFIAGIKGQWY